MINNKFKFSIPIYHKDMLLIISDDFDKSLKDIRITFEDSYNGCYGLALIGQGKYIILLDSKTGLTYSTLVHECLHITHYILRDIGVVSNFDNDEVETYLLGYITTKILKILDKNKIFIKI